MIFTCIIMQQDRLPVLSFGAIIIQSLVLDLVVTVSPPVVIVLVRRSSGGSARGLRPIGNTKYVVLATASGVMLFCGVMFVSSSGHMHAWMHVDLATFLGSAKPKKGAN